MASLLSPINGIRKVAKLFHATLFSTPLRGKKAQEIISCLLKEPYVSRIIIILILFLALYSYNDFLRMRYAASREMQMRIAVLTTLGGPAMPIISQCGTSRNLSEGIYARRSDIPGGFCFHADCDVTSPPGVLAENQYILQVLREKR